MSRQILADPAALAEAAAKLFQEAAQSANGPFHVALSGGRTPRAFYSLLSDRESCYRESIPWKKIHFYWSDERCVPPGNSQSNYLMAYESLLSRVPVLPGNIHRVQGELPDPAEAARSYENAILRELGARPRFDLIFLGMGPDGHTASLFPGSPAVGERDKLVTAVTVDQKVRSRVSFTLPLINAAARVAFVVSGLDKSEAVQRVLQGPPSDALPSSLVQPSSGRLHWLLDQAAASRLNI